jgi:hypothetical protein
MVLLREALEDSITHIYERAVIIFGELIGARFVSIILRGR